MSRLGWGDWRRFGMGGRESFLGVFHLFATNKIQYISFFIDSYFPLFWVIMTSHPLKVIVLDDRVRPSLKTLPPQGEKEWPATIPKYIFFI